MQKPRFSAIGSEPITLSEAKLYLKVDYTDEDALITSLIKSVREHVENFTGLALVAKTVEVFMDYIPERIELPFPEHNAITEVKFNGEVSDAYLITGLTQFIIKPTLQVTNTSINNYGMSVKYTTLGTCPEIAKVEMLKAIDEAYRNRGNTFEGSIVNLKENTYANLAQLCLV